MLREKSGNTSLTKWLDKSKHQNQNSSTRIATPSTIEIGQGHENNKDKEEIDLQLALEQSRKDYVKQQKQQYTNLSSLYSTQDSTLEPIYMMPSIDDDDAWFQSTPTSPSFRSTKRNKLSLSTKRLNSNLSSPKRKTMEDNSNSEILQSPSIEPVNLKSNKTLSSQKLASQLQHKDNDQDLSQTETTRVPKKEEEGSWAIEEDESWEIHNSQKAKVEDESWEIQSSQKAKVGEDTCWEIDGTDKSTNDKITSKETPPDDEMDEYMSSIRNRTTKNSTSSTRTSVSRRPATLLDDAFHLISQKQDSPRGNKKSIYVNAETDPAYNPPKVYQTLFDTTTIDRHDTAHDQANIFPGSESEMDDDAASDCSSIIDLCMESERMGMEWIDSSTDNHSGLFDDDGSDMNDDDDLGSLPYADDDFDTTVNDQHPFEIEDNHTQTFDLDNDIRNNHPPIEQQPSMEEEDDDSGYLSPLEGFISLLDQPDFNCRPYFDQLTASTVTPSRSSKRSPSRRPTRSRATPIPKGKRRFIPRRRYR